MNFKRFFNSYLPSIVFFSLGCFIAVAGRNVLTVEGDRILLNGGDVRLLGLRCSNSLVSDDSTDRLIRRLDFFKSHGVNSVSVYFMGSRFGDVQGYDVEGNIKGPYARRMSRIIEAADRSGMVVLVGCLYWGESRAKEGLAGTWGQAEANRAIANTVRWLSVNGYRNVFVDVDNEGMAHDAEGWSIKEMIDAAHSVDPSILVAYNARDPAPDNSDINIHHSPKVEGKPWLDTEATPKNAPKGYWGGFSKETHLKTQGAYWNYSRIGRYTEAMKRDQIRQTREGMERYQGHFFSSTWIQCGPSEGVGGPFMDPGGRSEIQDVDVEIDSLHLDAGFLWWLEFIKEAYGEWTPPRPVYQATNEVLVGDANSLVEAVRRGRPGDTIRLGEGVFALSAPLRPLNGMSLQGAGMDKTVVKGDPSWIPSDENLPGQEDPSAYLFDVRDVAGVSLSHMTLEGPSLHGAVHAVDSPELILHHLWVEDFRWCGVRGIRLRGLRAHDNVFVDAGGRIREPGGSYFLHWPVDSELWNNRISKADSEREFYGFKGYGGRNCRFHHNTVGVSFAVEFPHQNDRFMEIDHNAFLGTISIPKPGGGSVPDGGFSFYIHHNWLQKSHALEWPRNGVELSYNYFDFSPEDDEGDLVSSFDKEAAQGPTLFHHNQVRNPGRGLFWSQGVYSNLRFHHNEVRVETTGRKDGLFGFHPDTDFSTIFITDNLFRCAESNPRPLMRNEASYGVEFRNNQMIHVSDAESFPNPVTGEPVGLGAPLGFKCGVKGEYEVGGWQVKYSSPFH